MFYIKLNCFILDVPLTCLMYKGIYYKGNGEIKRTRINSPVNIQINK